MPPLAFGVRSSFNSYDAANLFRGLRLSAQFGHLPIVREEGACTLDVRALRILAVGQRVLDNSGEPRFDPPEP